MYHWSQSCGECSWRNIASFLDTIQLYWNVHCWVWKHNQVWIYCFWSWFLGAAVFILRLLYGFMLRIYSYVYKNLMLRLYICTAIHIVKYRHGIPFGNIKLLVAIFLALMRAKVTETSECRTSPHLSLFWTLRCVHWMSTSELFTLLPQTRDRSAVVLGKCVRIVCGMSSYNLHSTAQSSRQE